MPPRPKPGRKPATDTPPTKRKAQNRAAQRAFRERRAARVGELEEEIKKIEKEDEDEQNVLRGQIEKLEKDADEMKTSLNFWMQRCRGLEAELANAATREHAVRSLKGASSTSGFSSAPDTQTHGSPADEPAVGCGGNCSSINNCSCIQEVINMSTTGPAYEETDFSGSKRALSPAYRPPSSKRVKPEPPHELETDFTAVFSKGASSHNDDHFSASSSAVADPCGFCTDGTACICAEMQAEANMTRLQNQSNRSHAQPQANTTHTPSSTGTSTHSRSRMSELSHITPPPSDTDVTVSLPPITTLAPPSSTNRCANGPGTCQQCRSDPQSTLFCKSLARSRSLHPSPNLSSNPSGCCGGTSSGGSCCQTPSLPPLQRSTSSSYTPQSTTIPPLTISCADAYTTLSRHPGYERAMGTAEIGRWLPKLHAHLLPHRSSNTPTPNATSSKTNPSTDAVALRRTRGKAQGTGTVGKGKEVGLSPPKTMELESRPAMEIDAANVMAVLREFDRRFSE